eukprot:scaffold609522_cov17-Prasinocladus_malaysianus.AAC.1
MHYQNVESPFGSMQSEDLKAIVLEYAAAGELESLKHFATLSSVMPRSLAMQDANWIEPCINELRQGVEVETGQS